ncbi:MAG: hypothetical protein QNJ31_00720 [Candidatus Caenarcaniphilales bacterium]|nr:hypothetical protein [Candidatus Caenarcaniphilales bacterium]
MNWVAKRSVRKIFNSLIQEEDGAIYEFLGLIMFLFIVLGFLIPLSIELFIYSNQAQELDKLTKIAAKRACNLMPIPSQGIGSDINQSSLGIGTDVRVMQPLVNAVFQNEAASPESYFENTEDGQNINFKILDFLGQEIDKTDFIDITDRDGNKGQSLMVGSNTDTGLCPSGGGGNWKYCLSDDNAAKEALMKTGQPENEDLVARMEMFQPGRCPPGENCREDFAGRLDRCTVCATKSRQSIFSRTVFLSKILFLDCSESDNVTILPCKMTSCATSKYLQFSGKRGYAPHYRDPVNLGQTFRALEGNPNVQSQALSSGKADQSLFCLMLKGVGAKGMFDNLLGSDACGGGSLTGVAGDLAGGVTGAVGGVAKEVNSAAGNLTGGVTNAVGGITNGVNNVAGNLTDGVTNAVGDIKNGVNGITGDLTSGVTDAVGDVTNDINSIQGEINNVQQTFGDVVTTGSVGGGNSAGTTIGDASWDQFDSPGTFTCSGSGSLEDQVCNAALERDNALEQSERNLVRELDTLVSKYSNSLGSPEHIAEVNAAREQAKVQESSINQAYDDFVDSLSSNAVADASQETSNGDLAQETGEAIGSVTGTEVGSNIGPDVQDLVSTNTASSGT